MILGLSLGEIVGVYEATGRAWDLRMMTTRAHVGGRHQTFAEVLNTQFTNGSKIDWLAYLKPDATTPLNRQELAFANQLEGVLLMMASDARIDVLPLWWKSVAKIATGDPRSTEDDLLRAAQQNGVRVSSGRVASAYWITAAAEKEVFELT